MNNRSMYHIRIAMLAVLLLVSYWNTIAQRADLLNISIDSIYIEQDSIDVVSFKNPLKIIDRSSPQAVWMNFIKNMNSSYTLLMNANERNQEFPGYFIADEVKEEVQNAEFLFEKASYCLDLSKFPPSLQKDMGFGRAIILKEILDRIDLPPLENIPDYEAVEQDLETKKVPQLNYWRFPGTQIVLVKTQEGVFQGEYPFSSETIEKLVPLIQKIIKKDQLIIS